MAKIANLTGRIKEMWNRATPVQRWLTVGLSLALVGAVGIAVYLNRPEWTVLVRDADPQDAAAVVERLQELKVQYRPTGDGYTIMVPKSEEYTAKLALAQAGLPKGGSTGLEIFDEPKFGATEFDRKVNYLRAQQGELERALGRIDEVDYANVKLAIPERSVFLRDQDPVTAAVLIRPRSGKKLSQQQVTGIVNFVSSSVQGLSPEKVTVIDDSGRLLSNGAAEALLTDELDAEQLAQQQQLEQKMEQKLQTLLEPVFGPGNVVARVSLELTLDASRVESETVGAAVPRSTQTERKWQEQTGGGETTRVTEAGTPPVYEGQTDSGTGQTWESRTNTEYDVSHRTETVVTPPGGIKRVSAAITINRSDLSVDEIQKIQDTAAGATGADPADVAVLHMPFNREIPQELTPSTGVVSPTIVAVGLGAVAVLLLLAFFWVRRREGQLASEAALAGVPGGAVVTPGSTLDEALGLALPTDEVEPDGLGQEEVEAETGEEQAADEGEISSDEEALADEQAPADQDAHADDLAAVAEGVLEHEEEDLMPLDEEEQTLDPFTEEEKESQPVAAQHLVASVKELIESNPEICAQVLKQWLKGGS